MTLGTWVGWILSSSLAAQPTPAAAPPQAPQVVEKKPRCTLSAPAPFLEDKKADFDIYQVKKAPTLTTEIGKTQYGLVFTLTRGGCIEYGEVLVLQFNSQTHSAKEVSYWVGKVAKSLQELESGSSSSALAGRGKQLKELLEKRPDYQYGSTIKVGDDMIELIGTDLAERQVKFQVNVNASL